MNAEHLILQSRFSLPVSTRPTGVRRLFAPLGRMWSSATVRLGMRQAPRLFPLVSRYVVDRSQILLLDIFQ